MTMLFEIYFLFNKENKQAQIEALLEPVSSSKVSISSFTLNSQMKSVVEIDREVLRNALKNQIPMRTRLAPLISPRGV